jgi:hypothetical protein
MIEPGKLTALTSSKVKKLKYIESEIGRLTKQIALQEREMRMLVAHDLDCTGSGALIRSMRAQLEQHEAMLVTLVDGEESREPVLSDQIVQA